MMPTSCREVAARQSSATSRKLNVATLRRQMPELHQRRDHANHMTMCPRHAGHGQANEEPAGVPTCSCCLVRPPLDAWHRTCGTGHEPRQASPDLHSVLPLPNHWPNERPLSLGVVMELHTVWPKVVCRDAFVLMDLMYILQLMDDDYELF